MAALIVGVRVWRRRNPASAQILLTSAMEFLWADGLMIGAWRRERVRVWVGLGACVDGVLV